MIPGNLQKYVSTSRSPLRCKTLPAHFSNNMLVNCLLNLFKSTVSGTSTSTRVQGNALIVRCGSDSELKISKLFYIFKWANKKGRQSLWGFPRPEIIWKLHWGFTLYMYLFQCRFVLWKLESARITIENLSPQNNKDF